MDKEKLKELNKLLKARASYKERISELETKVRIYAEMIATKKSIIECIEDDIAELLDSL